MAVKVVQISVDPGLLSRIDQNPEVNECGRSAFIRSAVCLHFETTRHEVDRQIATAYENQVKAMVEESEDLLDAQAWPD